MKKELLLYLKRDEWNLRKKAVEYAFKDNRIETAIKLAVNLKDRHPILYRFRPPLEREIEMLKTKELFMCRPKHFEDTGDCKIEIDLVSLSKHFTDTKRKEYKIYKKLLTDGFYSKIAKKLDNHERIIKYKEDVRKDSFIACFSNNYNEKMWKEYSNDSEGFCAIYNTTDLIFFAKESNGVFFFPVRYVDDRSKCEDIIFNANEFGDDEKSFVDYGRKYYLSCFTKDVLPYSSEGEWRLMKYEPNIENEKSGIIIPFEKPRFIIKGKNIHRNPSFLKSLCKAAEYQGIQMVSAEEYNTIYAGKTYDY